MSKTTPMMKQYKKIRKQYPDAILMFRLGDFYEMFFEDAKTASKVLGIALTSRNKNSKNPVPLCGVPFHSIESYVTKLLENGYKVAICDQVEDPKLAKGIVERRVTQVLTPGAVLDTEKLDSKTNNFIAAVWMGKESVAISYADISTGAFSTTVLDSLDKVTEELACLEPREVLLPDELFGHEGIKRAFARSFNPLITHFETWHWDHGLSKELLNSHFKTRTLEAFGIEEIPEAIIACGAVLGYLEETQMDNLPSFENLELYATSDFLAIDEFTKTNLELQKPLRGTGSKNTLLWVLDETQTPMGGRLLKQWLNYPLLDPGQIIKRLEALEELIKSPSVLASLRNTLVNISDLERLVCRICTTHARPIDVASLRNSCYFISLVKKITEGFQTSLLEVLSEGIDDLADVAGLLERAIVDSPPTHLRDGGVIKDGYNDELDELRSIERDSKKWLNEIEIREREKTGIASLKVGFNKVFGYYIEVSRTKLYQVPDGYVRKQTLVNGERFITDELKQLEEKILSAEDKIARLEAECFEEVRIKIAGEAPRIRHTASSIAVLDVLAGFAEISERYEYKKPDLLPSGGIELHQSRHPVIERMDLDERFVPNDVKLDHKENQLLIITGPNMSGKSTIMRQVALNVIMAQMGCFVPSEKSRIGIVDKIFTRVGASDDLTRGQSTFMVEMVETAYILRHATNKSLIIFDEIGRGTSTFDGISLAWAVAEFAYGLGSLTMFATHYHQLSELAVSKKGVQNYNVYVKESADKIAFLRKLIPGATSHSYGIQVARLAGVPEKVLKTAKTVLSKLEKNQSTLAQTLTGGQTSLFVEPGGGADNHSEKNHLQALEMLKGLDIMELTPIEALNKLNELKNIVESGSE